MTDPDPYEVVGQLRTIRIKIICELEEKHLSPTYSNLVEALERQQAQEHSLINMYRELRIARKLLQSTSRE
jgi:hypothetical protein